MTQSKSDIWSKWLLERRFGGDPELMQKMMEMLSKVRDKVLQHADLGEGETLLDVGCGDGLIAFGALDTVETSKVIFSDISEDLLEQSRSIAEEMDSLERCQFVNASADEATLDAVTTRSVLIYVSAKQKSFDEFYRVLKPGGRLSLFEPINRYWHPGPPHMFMGVDVTPVMELAQKVEAIFDSLQPVDTDPMLDFGERDLIQFAEQAGFKEVHLELRVDVTPQDEDIKWESLMRIAFNPKIPTLEEAMQQALTSVEVERLVAHMRPLVESRQSVERKAHAYVWAVK